MKEINQGDLMIGISLGAIPLIFVYHLAFAIPVFLIFLIGTVIKNS